MSFFLFCDENGLMELRLRKKYSTTGVSRVLLLLVLLVLYLKVRCSIIIIIIIIVDGW